jgi:hypothetical protein
LPVLVQVKYRNNNYNKIIPPVPEMRVRPQEITVYETTEDSSVLKIKNLIQVTRHKDSLSVLKLYLIENTSRPPRAYQNSKDPVEIYIPDASQEVFGQLSQGDSRMAIPLTLEKGKTGRLLGRAILPGPSELNISFKIPAESGKDVIIDDIITFEKSREGILFVKPSNMQVKSKWNVNIKELQDKGIPEGFKAFQYNYENNKSELEFIGGTPEPENLAPAERKIVNGDIFTTPEKSILGIIGVLAILFTFSALIRIPGIKK